MNNPHLTPLSPADNGARREAVLPIVMRGFRERLSAIDTTDLIIASLSPTTTDAVRGEVEAKSISVAEEWSFYMDEAVSKAPEPLRKLGEYLADLLYEDQWKTAERYLNAAVLATLHPSPEDPSGGQDVERIIKRGHDKVMIDVALGKWLSAALDDPDVCTEMKADIRAWFSSGEPVEEQLAQLAALATRSEADDGALREALDAAHYYIDASPTELAEAGTTRDDALLKARELRSALATPPEPTHLVSNIDGGEVEAANIPQADVEGLCAALSYAAVNGSEWLTEAECDAAAAVIRALREALAPFANYRGSDEYLKSAEDDGLCAAASFTAGQYRAARAVLKGDGGPHEPA
ncbi:MAG: hypothetical protein AAB281_03760 [Actinomycetota bacterium]